MYTIELARRLRAEDTGVTANVVDPFLVRTAFTSADDVPLLFKLARPLMIQPQTHALGCKRSGRRAVCGHDRPAHHVRTSRSESPRVAKSTYSQPSMERVSRRDRTWRRLIARRAV